MADPISNTTSTLPPPTGAIYTTSTYSEIDLPTSSSPSSLSVSSTISSLFPDLQVADHFLPDDNYYYEDDDDNNIDDFSIGGPLANLSSSSPFPCISSNTSSSSLLSSLLCINSDDLTKTKIYSSEDLWAENEIFARKLAPAMVFIAFLMTIGILGNTVVVYVYGFRFKTATQHFLIVCLACFDLVMCTVAMPTEIADIRFHHTFTSVFACKLLRFVTMFASISSSFTLVTVAYDRHRRITKPLSKQMSMKQARFWMLSNMFAALCFSWPTLVLTGIRSSETRISGLEGTDCSFSERFKKTKYPLVYNAVLGIGFFTLITVIAVFYFRIWKTAKTRKINMAKRYTIGSLSDQFMNELKLQRQISKEGVTEILSKQLEKCVKESLQAKPSIDCKDLYYFFENNSIRSTIGSGIAKKRGRYKGFSVSSSDESSRNSEDSCVLGHSFSYRTSVNCRRRDRNWEEDEEEEKEKEKEDGREIRKGKISRKSRYVGRHSSKISKSKSFSMAKIPEQPFSGQNKDELRVHGVENSSKTNMKTFSYEKETSLQSSISCNNNYDNNYKNNNNNKANNNSNIDDDKHKTRPTLESRETETRQKDCCNNVRHSKSYLDSKTRPSDSKYPCERSRSNSPFLPVDTNEIEGSTTLISSPCLSIKSASSSATNSPGRYRRNSSPLIGQRRHHGKVKAKTELKNSISVISDDFRPRPMSSLVDSVSQTLGRMQEFTDFDSNTRPVAELVSLESLGLRPKVLIHRNYDDNKIVDEDDYEKNKGHDNGVCFVDETNNYFSTDEDLNGKCNHVQNINGGIFTCQMGCDTEVCSHYLADRDQQLRNNCLSESPVPCNNGKEIVLLPKDMDELLSRESFYHLIGPRSRPIEISPSLNDVSGDVTAEDSNGCQGFGVVPNGDLLSVDEDLYHTNNRNNISCETDPIVRECSSIVDPNSNGIQKNIDDTSSDMFFSSSSDLLQMSSHDRDEGSQSSGNATADPSCHMTNGLIDIKMSSTTTTLTLTSPSTTKPLSSVTEDAMSTASTTTTASCVSMSTSAATSIPTVSSPTGGGITPCDISGVQTRKKPRSFSNISLDAIAPTTTNRRKKTRCVCLFQNMDKTTVVAFTVSSVFILSFLPFLILMFIRGLVKDFDYSLDGATLCIYHIFLRFYFLNSAINPFLYGLLNVNFRYECVLTWRKVATCFHGADKNRLKKDAVIC